MLTFNEWLLERGDEEYIRKLMTRKPARFLSPRERMASSIQAMSQKPEFTGDEFEDESEVDRFYRIHSRPEYINPAPRASEEPEPGREEALAKQMVKYKDERKAQEKKNRAWRKKMKKARLKRQELDLLRRYASKFGEDGSHGTNWA